LKNKAVFMAFLIFPFLIFAKNTFPIPTFNIGVGESTTPHDLGMNLQIMLLITVLSLAPTVLIMLTSFTRVIIVFSFMRQAMGTPSMPSNAILVNMALILTLFIMNPVYTRIYDNAVKPYMNKKISQAEAFHRAMIPLRAFMFKQTREEDLKLFLSARGIKIKPKSRKDISFFTLMPAFVMSEVKTAFQMGVVIFVPFLVIDMVVASTLMSMGMIMLPPVMISLPFKVLLFVMSDGWSLVIKSLVDSFK
jgi:flagellar biosynthetic protein FliP